MDDKLTFRRSSRCSEGAGCVAVAVAHETAYMRDDKLGEPSPVLAFSPTSWRAFITSVKAGEFDA